MRDEAQSYMTNERRQKIGIVGAGSVGATIAYACMIRGVGKHISLFDIRRPSLKPRYST
jgi:malate/lactate dehydrogenase